MYAIGALPKPTMKKWNLTTLVCQWNLQYEDVSVTTQVDYSLAVVDSTYLYKLSKLTINAVSQIALMKFDKSTGNLVKVYMVDTALTWDIVTDMYITADGNLYGAFRATTPSTYYFFHYSVSGDVSTIYQLAFAYDNFLASSLNTQ